mgnify:CR=1 FL=1
MYYFGAPVSPEKLKDYSEHHAQTCAPAAPSPRLMVGVLLSFFPCVATDHFPDAFVGSNVKVWRVPLVCLCGDVCC